MHFSGIQLKLTEGESTADVKTPYILRIYTPQYSRRENSGNNQKTLKL